MSQLFLTLLHIDLAAALLVVAVLVVRFLLKRFVPGVPSAFHCALWALVALRLLLPFSLQSPLSLIPEEVAGGEVLLQWREAYVGDTMVLFDEAAGYDAAVEAGREQYYAGEEGHYYVVTGEDGISPPATVETALFPLLGWVWLAGCLIMVLYAAVSFLSVRNKVGLWVPLRDNIRRCEGVDSPFILGFFRPVICLPYHMDEAQMQYVIAHEEAHLRRRDHWWKPLGFLLLALHWFNPLVWVAYVLLCRDIELACDEKVIRDMDVSAKKAYSEALLSCSLPRRMVAACPLAFGEVGVKERITSVLHYKKPAFWVMVVAVLACIVVAVCFLTSPAEDAAAEENLPAVSEAIFSRVDASYPEDMLAYLCQADLWDDAIEEKPEISVVGNFDTTAIFPNKPDDTDELDIAMARRAFLLMRLYPNEVFYVQWSYPDENGGQVRRDFHADEMSAIVSLSSHTEVIASPDSAERVERQLGFLGSLDEKLFLRFAHGEALSAEELADFNEQFQPTLYDKQLNFMGMNPLCCFFTSYYDDVRELDFKEFMRYFPNEGLHVTEEEFQALKGVEGWPFTAEETMADLPVPISKYSARIVDMVLKEHAGITTADLDTSGVAYLAEYDAYYNYTSDFGPGMFTCTRGERVGELLYLYEETEQGTDRLTLRKTGNAYHILAHQSLNN